MKHIRTTCDRCGEFCGTGMTVLATAGSLAVRIPEQLDLCGDCSVAFSGFMKSKQPNTQTKGD